MMVRAGQNNKLYENKGNGNFAAAEGAGPVTSDTDNSRGVAWGDYDGDGDLDLIVVNGDIFITGQSVSRAGQCGVVDWGNKGVFSGLVATR